MTDCIGTLYSVANKNITYISVDEIYEPIVFTSKNGGWFDDIVDRNRQCRLRPSTANASSKIPPVSTLRPSNRGQLYGHQGR